MTELTNDHQILVGSTTTDLRLARDQSGRALYSVTPDKVGQPFEIGQKNWIGGHGQYEYEDGTMYFKGQSIDTTQEGRVLLGPKINEVYAGATQRENLTTGDDSELGVAMLVGSTYKYGAQTFTPAASHTIQAVRVKLARRGNPGTITASIRATTGGDLHPDATVLCSGTIDGNALSTTATWYTIALEAGTALTSGTMYALVLSGAAGTVSHYAAWRFDGTSAGYANGHAWSSSNSGSTWVDLIAEGESGFESDFMFEEYSLDGTALDTTPTQFLWAASISKFLCATSGRIYYYNIASWTAATTTVAGVTHLVEFNGVIYAAMGASTKWYYSTDADTWTQTDLDNAYAVKFLNAPNKDGTTNLLWYFKTPNLVYTTSDGRTIAAGGVQPTQEASIGDTTSNITNIFMNSDEHMLGRADNLYNYDANGGIHALMDELKTARTAKNFQYVQNWNGATYASVGTGVREMIGGRLGIVNEVSPLLETGDIDKVGTCVGITADKDYLYIGMLEETVTHIYKCKATRTGWQYCPWVYLGTNNCEVLYVAQHSETDRRLWFGYGTHTGYVQITDNPTTDANARFAASGFVRMSYLYGTNPYWDKMYQSIVREFNNPDVAACTISTYYRKDIETSMTVVNSVEPIANNVTAFSFETPISCKKIQFQCTLATTNSTQSPQLRKFIVRGVEKPEVVRVHEATYTFGQRPSRRTKTDRDALRTALISTSLVKFSDLRYDASGKGTAGTQGTDWVYVIVESVEEVETASEKERDPDLGLRVRMREVNV